MWILGATFLVTVGYAFIHRIEPVVDAKAYDRIAMNLAEGYGFREDRTKSFEEDSAMLRAGPGYEFFLAGLYRVFGYYYEVVWIAQAFLHCATAYLLFLLGRSLFKENGEKVGLFASAIFGFHPDLIEIAAMLMTETLALFFVTLSLWGFVRLTQKGRPLLWGSVLAVSLSIGVLVRPPMILFIPVILFWFFFKRRWIAGGVFLFLFVLFLTPWTIRNYQHYHVFIPTTLIGQYNLWIGNTLESDGGQIASGFNPVIEHVEEFGVIAIKEEAPKAFRAFVQAYPTKFFELTFTRFVRFFSLIRPMGFWFYQEGISLALFVALSASAIGFLFVFGVAGMILWIQRKEPLSKYFFLFGIVTVLPLLTTVVQSRYRFPIYPLLALTTGYAMHAFLKKEKAVQRVLLFTIVFFALVGGIDMFLSWQIIIERIRALL